MNDWKVQIEKTVNGYIITIDENKTSVIEILEGEETKQEQLAFQKLAYLLKEHFGVYNDKHKNQYLEIKVSGEEQE